MKIRQCQHCQGDFDSTPYAKGPPRQYCSASCRSLASYYRKTNQEPDPARVLQGKIGMAERYGHRADAEGYREQLRQLKSEDE